MSHARPVSTLVLACALGLSAPVLSAADNHHHHGHTGQAALTAQAEGVLEAIDREAGTVTLSHGPIPALRWPPMTMDLRLRDAALADGVAAGDRIRFTLEQVGPTDYEIIELKALD